MCDDLWKNFLETGSVDDFLRYTEYAVLECVDGDN